MYFIKKIDNKWFDELLITFEENVASYDTYEEAIKFVIDEYKKTGINNYHICISK